MEIFAGLCRTSLLHFVAHMQRVELKMVSRLLCFDCMMFIITQDLSEAVAYAVVCVALIGHGTVKSF